MLLSLPAVLSITLTSVCAIAQPAPDPMSSRLDLTSSTKAADTGKAPPPIFTDLTLADALAKNTGEHLLIVKFTAEWCGPCKQMDRTTWRDQRVIDWVKQHGTAIQVDVDKRPDDAKSNRISAMPTTVVFKEGKPIQRRVGFITADQMLTFLSSAKNPNQGQHEAQVKPAEGGAAPKAAMSMQDRLRAARDLADNDKRDQATSEYVWLWKNILEHEPSMYGVRRSFMTGDMQRLAFVHKPASEAFAALRDEAETRLKGPDKTFEDLLDWIALNGVVDQQDKTLAWFDRIKGDADSGPTLKRVGFTIDQLLIDRGRWADLALIWPDPLGTLKNERDLWLNMPNMGGDAERKAELDRMSRNTVRTKAAQIYVSQLAIGKPDVAQRVQDDALKADDTPEMRIALVKLALKAKLARPEHDALLKSAIRPDNPPALSTEIERLQAELAAALAKGTG
ncbi:MAG: thioredoxin family protein [Phycisphaerales bacterium]|nr:thioredoxin family protein [Phycisphaerales bacterium]